jgi:hypothetical protein
MFAILRRLLVGWLLARLARRFLARGTGATTATRRR